MTGEPARSPGPRSGAIVERFHRVLVAEIRSARPEYLTDSFTVAEIYQHLVPYRTHRDRLGVEMNADYEDALLRLLAGEGDYVVLESEAAVREIRSELRTSNPDTTLYRNFAAADVRLNPERVPAVGEDGGPDLAPTALDVERGGGPSDEACPYCGRELPSREELAFCPFCGNDQRTRPCPACGSTVEARWSFCIACGEAVPPPGGEASVDGGAERPQ